MVLAVLADHADDGHGCFPSIDRIAKRAGLCRRGAQNVIQRLAEAKLIICIGSKGRRSNRYRLPVVETRSSRESGAWLKEAETVQEVHGSEEAETSNQERPSANRAPRSSNRAGGAPEPTKEPITTNKEKEAAPAAAPPYLLIPLCSERRVGLEKCGLT
jgi:hypothetical protein